MKLLKNKNGMTLVEIIISIGLMGAIAVGVTNLSKNSSKQVKSSLQNTVITKATSQIQDALSKVASCNLIITNPAIPNLAQARTAAGADAAGKLTDGTIVTAITTSELPVITAIPANSTKTIPIELLIIFNKDFGSTNISAARSVNAQLLYENNTAALAIPTFVSCAEYEALAIRSTFKLNCENIGGTFIDAQPYSCDVSNIDNNSYFADKVRKDLCTKLFSTLGDAYDSTNQKCKDFVIDNNGVITGANMGPNSISLSGNARTTFNQTNCSAANTYIKSININGTVNCISVEFCKPGDANCPIAAVPGSKLHCQTDCNCSLDTEKGNTCMAQKNNAASCTPKNPPYLPNGGTWVAGQYGFDFQCHGLNCRFRDYLTMSGTNAFDNSSTITLHLQKNLTSPSQSCSVTNTYQKVAGLCQRFTSSAISNVSTYFNGHSSGTKDGLDLSTIAPIENAPNGTTCSSNGYCKSGACAVNGQCSSAHYGCQQGYAINTSTNSSSYNWQCAGINGGTTASCSETKPPPPASCVDGDSRWGLPGSCPTCTFPQKTCEREGVYTCSAGAWSQTGCHLLCVNSNQMCP